MLQLGGGRGSGLEQQRSLQCLRDKPGECCQQVFLQRFEDARLPVADDQGADHLTGDGQREKRPGLPVPGRHPLTRVGLQSVEGGDRGQKARLPGAGDRGGRVRMIQRQFGKPVGDVRLVAVVISQLQGIVTAQEQRQAMTAGRRPQHRPDRGVHLGARAGRHQGCSDALQCVRAGRGLLGPGDALGELALPIGLFGDLPERHDDVTGAAAADLGLPDLAEFGVRQLPAPRRAGVGDAAVPVGHGRVLPTRQIAEPVTDQFLRRAPDQPGAELVDVFTGEVGDRTVRCAHRTQHGEAVESRVEHVVQPGAAGGPR